MSAVRPIELAIRAVNRARRSAYRAGLLRARRLPRPVISIGNRSVGGSGKTPAAIAIARGLLERGVRPAILTRGYGRDSREEPLRVDSADPARFGDEPVVMAASLPGVPVVVGADRGKSGSWLLETESCDAFLLDDGFQHLQLDRDVDVVIEGAGARWLREGESALAVADLVLDRRPGSEGDGDRTFRAGLLPVGWIGGGEKLPLGGMAGERVVAFAGLADPAQFFAMLRAVGVQVESEIAFRDHHRYGPEDVARIERERTATGAVAAVTTRKDAVKTDRLGLASVALEVEMEIDPRERFFDRLLRVARENFDAR